MKLIHIRGNLFDAPPGMPIAQAVSEDGAMSKGIAKIIQAQFNVRSEFLSYGGRVGMTVAVWRNEKFIVNLITKQRYFHLPTIVDLTEAVKSLRQFLLINNISEFACPEISAGLDRVPLETVINIMTNVFQHDDITIYMYHL